ncbi:MAG: glycosyltransferase family 2 protein, partial [Cyclobacteriaceae bacterium]
PKYSVVIPVYNRPEEVNELLASLVRQTYQNFEVILVEDGSSVTSQSVFETYAEKLDIKYYFKPNTGPGPSRNFGFEKARGDYFVVFDSDCVIPSTYFQAVEQFMANSKLDAWGGPDRGHENFTPLQQAMGYTMSSFLTTGGIRGGKKKLTWFQPRSFNMGISRAVYETLGGFKLDRYAEDIEFAIRMRKAGFKAELISEAFVYHKRRTSLKEFFRQVRNFGKGRAIVGRLHPSEIKIAHWLPFLFTLGLFAAMVMAFVLPPIGLIMLAVYGLYTFVLAVDAFGKLRSWPAALFAVPSAYVQLIGYGVGFLKERLKG